MSGARTTRPGLGRALEALLASIMKEGLVSAGAGLVGDGSEILAASACGQRIDGDDQAPTIDSWFDLASLSKPLTGTLAVALDADGSFSLGTELGEVWSALDPRLSRVSGEDLLRHRAGLRAWAPLYGLAATREEALDLLLSGGFLGEEKPTYSDLGYILWAASAERALGQDLESLLRSRILDPLGLVEDLSMHPSAAAERLVECNLVPRRERQMASEMGTAVDLRAPARGEAQDGNARWCKGYCGHAGLFGSGRGLWKLAREWLTPSVLPTRSVRTALRPSGAYRLGWWTPTGRGSAGPDLGPRAFGHTGFTGGSVWVDPDRDRIFVLLAHRREDSTDLDPWRRSLHALS